MFIEGIKIDIITESKRKFGRYISLLKEDGTKREISLIYGENNLGKSTLIKSIIYALGGEDLYGKSSWNDTIFPPIMYMINGESIIQNIIYLQIINKQNKRVTIARNALERTAPVIVYNDVAIEDIETSTSVEYYKIKKDIGIDGNKTFNDFLFQFFSIPEVQYEGIKVYFQNLLPLFIIPQTSWNDIQAVNPYYGVPELKQKAFEILMNFSTIENLSEKIKLKVKREELKEKKRSMEDLEDILLVFKYKTLIENQNAIESQKQELSEYEIELDEIENNKVEVNDSVRPLREKLRRLSNIARRQETQLDTLKKEIDEYNYYINKINLDIDKIDKLSTAKKIFSLIPIRKCPHCLNDISINEKSEIESNNCSLCGSDFMINNHPKSEQLYSYLLDEQKDFKKLKTVKEIEKTNIESKLFLLDLDINEIQSTLNELEIKLAPGYLKRYHFVSREIGRLNNELNNLTREQAIISKYDTLSQELESLYSEISTLVSALKGKNDENDDQDKLKYFTSEFKKFLKKLEFIKNGFDGSKLNEAADKIFNQITIDQTDYKPKIDRRNLFNITSSSGLIRIIISYYLSLLKTSLKKNTNFPCIIIFDEPRQQNLDKDTFNEFTKILKDLQKNYRGEIQIIYTSGNKGTLTNEDIVLDLGDDTFLIEEF
ncbi:AAA family ATPase [Peribacillus frigoritolerans]|uniref:AAA family ATPase n=1 Tax=Peribacillus frigoritolerans TaxID=450367 RepID=UPI002079E6F7|nr:AAA family ATPase [Peribacillus frigoritolerans]USK65877.1 AAA family ATPase [Peribacillus frigoritolerans]